MPNKVRLIARMFLLLALPAVLLVGCGAPVVATVTNTGAPTTTPDKSKTDSQTPKTTQPATPPATTTTTSTQKAPDGKSQVASDPNSLLVLVNKQYSLPAGFKPQNLVDGLDVPFIFAGKDEKRMMRADMEQALLKLFAGAKQDGIYLAGVSAYRSEALQTVLFNQYVQQQGYAEATRYSALPGHSEHETGLAIDVSGSTGKCAADNCFAGTPEAKWLAQHAQDYGFIIRYPQGKENITGYAYEPWHIRYVGVKVAQEITAKGETLEDYIQQHPDAASEADAESSGSTSSTTSSTSP